MTNRWVFIALLAGVATAVPTVLSAQAPKRQLDPKMYNEELTPGQIERAQDTEPPAPARPTQKAPSPKAPSPARAVACSGAFAKDSSHLKLASAYKSENVVFTEVDTGSAKIMASVLFPKDPKRRLEVWWENEAARQGIHLIVFNGQTTWTAPKGLRLTMPLAAVEKVNGKPFKLKGLDKDGIATISDWQGGALGSLAGGCKVGAFMRPDPKSSPTAREEASGDKEFASNDTPIKAIKPQISEMILGY
jgi:hypothetical protein